MVINIYITGVLIRFTLSLLCSKFELTCSVINPDVIGFIF